MCKSLHTKRNFKILSLFAIALVSIGLSGCGDITNAGNITVAIPCPTSTYLGDPLNIELALTNTTSSPISIAKTGILATLGNLNIIGPFVIPYQVTIPASQEIITSGYLHTTFPKNAVRGMFSSIGIAVLDQDNKIQGVGGCLIQVD